MTRSACFPALGTGCVFSRALHRLHVFPRFTPVVCFSALYTGCVFPRALHRLHVTVNNCTLAVPRHLASIVCFSSLDTSCFLRLARVTCFRVLASGSLFSRAWHRLYVFPRFDAFQCFSLLISTTCMFSYRGLLPVAFFPLLIDFVFLCLHDVFPNLDSLFSFFVVEKTNSEKKTKSGEARSRCPTRTSENSFMTAAKPLQYSIYKVSFKSMVYLCSFCCILRFSETKKRCSENICEFHPFPK